MSTLTRLSSKGFATLAAAALLTLTTSFAAQADEATSAPAPSTTPTAISSETVPAAPGTASPTPTSAPAATQFSHFGGM